MEFYGLMMSVDPVIYILRHYIINGEEQSTRSRNNEEEIQLLWFCDLGTLTEKHCSSRRFCANVIGNILSNYVTSIGFLSVIHPLAPVILVTVILHLSGQIRKKDRRLSCRLDDVNFVCTFLNCAVSYPG